MYGNMIKSIPLPLRISPGSAPVAERMHHPVKNKRREKHGHGVFMQNHNAAVHTSEIAMNGIKECGF